MVEIEVESELMETRRIAKFVLGVDICRQIKHFSIFYGHHFIDDYLLAALITYISHSCCLLAVCHL